MLAGEAGELAKLTVTSLKKSHQESTVRHPLIISAALMPPRAEIASTLMPLGPIPPLQLLLLLRLQLSFYRPR
jgi:hypothetical protein